MRRRVGAHRKGRDFRQAASTAKYAAVAVAREAGVWAADIFGAASVMLEHPVHKFPMDAWAASLGEGTQDVQKLVIFREIMKNGRGLPVGLVPEQEPEREQTFSRPA